jgi:hypothetical protein
MKIGDKEINEILIKFLGTDAFNNSDFQVSEDISKLTKAVNYLIVQFKIIKNYSEDSEIKEQIESIITNTKNILTEKNGRN